MSFSSSLDISYHAGKLLNRFQRNVGALSESVLVGNGGDKLAAFRSPEQLNDLDINSEDQWKELRAPAWIHGNGWGPEVYKIFCGEARCE